MTNLTMNTKEFRQMMREAGVEGPFHTNPRKGVEDERNVGALVWDQKKLLAVRDLMKSKGHDPDLHGLKVCEPQRQHYSMCYIRCKAKFEK